MANNKDPYAAYGGSAKSSNASDPYAAYGGSSSNTTATPEEKPQPTWGSSLQDVVKAPFQEVGNILSGAYHTLTDEATPEELERYGASGMNGKKEQLNSVLGHVGLAADRMLVDPSRQELKQVKPGVPIKDYFKVHPTADANANAEHIMDAIPIVGPWAHKYQNDVQNEGALAATEKLATDVFSPKLAAKVLGSVAEAGGKGTTIAAASPETQALKATRTLVPGTPGETLLRGLKPSNAMYPGDFETLTNNVMPDIIRAAGPNPGVSGFADAAELSRIRNNNVFQKTMLEPSANIPIDLRPVGLAQRASTPPLDALDPDAVAANRANAVKFGVTKPLGEVDQMRVNANQKLHAFNDQSGTSKWAAQGNPEVAGMKAIHDSLAEQEYKAISDRTGIPVDEIRAHQAQYGNLRDIDDIAHKRATVYGRQNPISLPESLALSPGQALSHPIDTLFNFGLQHLLKGVTGSDALVNSAIDRFEHPYDTPMIAGQGLARRAAFPLGKVIEDVGSKTKKLPVFSPGSKDRE